MSCRHPLYLVFLLSLSACSGLSPVSSRIEEPSLEEHPGSEVTRPIDESEVAEIADTTRRGVRRFATWLGEEVNDWFGDKPFSEGGKVSHGRLSIRLRWEEHEGTDTNVRFRARFDLPNLRDKAYVFFGKDDERELIADQPETFTREQRLTESRRGDQTGFIGLGFNLRDYVDFRVGVRGGLKPYSQMRYRRHWMLSERNRAEFGETVFLRIPDGFGSTTTFELAHAYTSSLSFKWQNAATITKKTDGFAWSSSMGAFRTFGDNKLLSLEALINGETNSKDDSGEYGLRLKWRQPVYREWLLADLILGHFWPRGGEDVERDRERSWAASAGLIMRF